MIDPALAASGDQLAREIQDARERARGRQANYPEELRSRIVAYAEVCHERGASASRVARRLGLDQSTLSRWQRHSRRQSSFRRVAIVPAAPGPGTEAEVLRLVTPRGFVVEGLSVDALAYLLSVVE